MRRAPVLNNSLSRVPERQGSPRSVHPPLVTVAETDYSPTGGGGQAKSGGLAVLRAPPPCQTQPVPARSDRRREPRSARVFARPVNLKWLAEHLGLSPAAAREAEEQRFLEGADPEKAAEP